MPLTTRVPQNGGSGTGTSVATSDRIGAGSRPGAGAVRSSGPVRGRPRRTRRWRSAGRLRAWHAALDRHRGVHQPQPLERVAGVPDLAVEQARPGPARRRTGSARRRRAAPATRPASPREFSSARLSRITTVDLTSSPDMPITSAWCSIGGLDDRRDRLLDAEVDDVVAVVGQDDVDQVLADVVHVALDRGQHDRALALVPDRSMCGSR